MKITKPGIKIEKKLYYGFCPKCQCEFTCNEDEVSNQSITGISLTRKYLWICPNKSCLKLCIEVFENEQLRDIEAKKFK